MRSVTVLFAICLAVSVLWLASSDADGEAAAIKEVVESSYIRGVHIERNSKKIRSGFHADFVMFIRTDEGLQKVELDPWIEFIERARDSEEKHTLRHEFTEVSVTGKSAVAQVEIHRDGKHIYTDYLSLYKFPKGWRIVTKIFESY